VPLSLSGCLDINNIIKLLQAIEIRPAAVGKIALGKITRHGGAILFQMLRRSASAKTARP
jgi:hypothetical protein